MEYKDRIIQIPKRMSMFLLGVRGTGKTLFLKRHFPEACYIDLLDESVYQSYLSRVSLFYEKVNSFKNNGVVIVDEIQRMPRLLNEVHRLIESSDRQFILTGSSARKLKVPGVNLLGGRAGTSYIHPFLPEELGTDFNLNEVLRYGLLPVVWGAGEDKHLALKAYIETYLKEEIKAEALVRNLPSFARFLEVATLFHGQTVNMNAIARECEISRNIVRDYFSILEDTMMGFFLPAYSPKLRLREKKHKKFYFIDPGLVRSIRKTFSPVIHAEKGFLLEGLVVQILRAYRDYRQLYEEMFYWSPAESRTTEVDILLKRGKEFIAIEVKSSTQVSAIDYKGLRAVQDLSGLKKRIVIHLGTHVGKTTDGIEIWPVDVFCQHVQNDRLY